MKSASLLSRLSAIFIDFVIWGLIIIFLVIMGVKLNEYLSDNTGWYQLTWLNKVKQVPFNKYIVSGSNNKTSEITKLYNVNQFDSNIEKYTINRLYGLAFDIGFVVKTKEEKKRIIRTLFYKEIFPDILYKNLSEKDKSNVDKSFESYISKTINEDLSIFDENKTFPTNDTLKIVVDVPINKEDDFNYKANKLKINTVKLKRYYVEGQNFYIQDKDVSRFLTLLSRKGLNAYRAVPEVVDVEVFNLDVNFLVSVLILVIYSLLCSFILLLSWALFESSKLQGTPGKLLLHIKVVDEEGNRLSYEKAFKRGFYRLLSILILGIGYLYLFGKGHRALHDVWSKTWVVEKS